MSETKMRQKKKNEERFRVSLPRTQHTQTNSDSIIQKQLQILSLKKNESKL
jgi:hypothetical protein